MARSTLITNEAYDHMLQIVVKIQHKIIRTLEAFFTETKTENNTLVCWESQLVCDCLDSVLCLQRKGPACAMELLSGQCTLTSVKKKGVQPCAVVWTMCSVFRKRAQPCAMELLSGQCALSSGKGPSLVLWSCCLDSVLYLQENDPALCCGAVVWTVCSVFRKMIQPCAVELLSGQCALSSGKWNSLVLWSCCLDDVLYLQENGTALLWSCCLGNVLSLQKRVQPCAVELLSWQCALSSGKWNSLVLWSCCLADVLYLQENGTALMWSCCLGSVLHVQEKGPALCCCLDSVLCLQENGTALCYGAVVWAVCSVYRKRVQPCAMELLSGQCALSSGKWNSLVL